MNVHATNRPFSPTQIVLASRSPRRKELLTLVAGPHTVEVVPPVDPTEPGFDGLRTDDAIMDQLGRIARSKFDDVSRQLGPFNQPDRTVILSADTAIVAGEGDDGLVVLGQPPDDSSYANIVRHWFVDLLIGREHRAMTALCVGDGSEDPILRVVETRVRFRSDTQPLVDWYIATDEPRGKAGAYAIQGAGSVFVESIQGSISNVVGLPLNETIDLLTKLRVDV